MKYKIFIVLILTLLINGCASLSNNEDTFIKAEMKQPGPSSQKKPKLADHYTTLSYGRGQKKMNYNQKNDIDQLLRHISHFNKYHALIIVSPARKRALMRQAVWSTYQTDMLAQDIKKYLHRKLSCVAIMHDHKLQSKHIIVEILAMQSPDQHCRHGRTQ